jgi:hypothetical protein
LKVRKERGRETERGMRAPGRQGAVETVRRGDTTEWYSSPAKRSPCCAFGRICAESCAIIAFGQFESEGERGRNDVCRIQRKRRLDLETAEKWRVRSVCTSPRCFVSSILLPFPSPSPLISLAGVLLQSYLYSDVSRHPPVPSHREAHWRHPNTIFFSRSWSCRRRSCLRSSFDTPA